MFFIEADVAAQIGHWTRRVWARQWTRQGYFGSERDKRGDSIAALRSISVLSIVHENQPSGHMVSIVYGWKNPFSLNPDRLPNLPARVQFVRGQI